MNIGDIVKLKSTVINWFPKSSKPRAGIIIKKEEEKKPWNRRFNVMFSDNKRDINKFLVMLSIMTTLSDRFLSITTTPDSIKVLTIESDK